ncbi:MAG: signal peptidase I [Anaerovoracaceae bacterium]
MTKRLFIYLAAALTGILCAFILSGVFFITSVMGSGMEPNIDDGNIVLVNKLAYSSSSPETGDVIAVRNHVYGEEGEGSILVRRVAAGSGDIVEIKDDIFYLNGKPYTEYMKEAVHMEDMDKVKLKKDEIFILSDNRKSSMDSRNQAIGIVDEKDCMGKVCFK